MKQDNSLDKKHMKQNKFKSALKKTFRSLSNFIPLIIGVVILISIINVWIPKEFYGKLFSKNIFFNMLIGDALGSVLAGNSITSYILGGEFLKQGISLFVVTTFVVSWVTVGIVQLPVESIALGKRFAILRNLSAFILSILVAVITVWLVMLI